MLASGGAPSPAVAQESGGACAPDCFVLTSVAIQGVTAYPLADLAELYQDQLTREIGVSDLVAIATAITDKYRADGYFLTRAAVAPVEPGTGRATIVVYEGYVGEVRIEGVGGDVLSPLLQPLAGPRPLSVSDLDRGLALASDIPGLSVSNRIEPVLGDPARHALVVETTLKRATGGLYLENRGSESQGPWQIYMTSAVNSAAIDGDQLTLSALTTPEDPDELTFAEMAYSVALSDGRRVRLSASGYATDAPPTASGGWIGSRSAAASASLAQPLVRSRRRSLWANASIEARRVEQAFALVGSADERLSVARLWLSGQNRLDGGYFGGSIQISHGLDLFDATTTAAPALTRSDADGQFTKLNLNLSGYHDLSPVTGVYGQFAAQWSDDALLGSEEFFVGGPNLGRAFSYGEAGGDDGIAGMAEFRWGWPPKIAPLEFVQFFGFIDAAWLSDRGPLRRRTTNLSSAGFGVRLTLKRETAFKLEFAKPLARPEFSSRDDGWRAYASLSKEF